MAAKSGIRPYLALPGTVSPGTERDRVGLELLPGLAESCPGQLTRQNRSPPARPPARHAITDIWPIRPFVSHNITMAKDQNTSGPVVLQGRGWIAEGNRHIRRKESSTIARFAKWRQGMASPSN